MQVFVLQTVGGFTSGGDTGGGVLELIGLAEEWAKAGHDVHFITNASDQGELQYHGGYHLHRVPSLGLHRQPSALHFMIETLFNPLLQWQALKGILGTHLRRPAVVLTPSPYPSDTLAAFLVRRFMGIPAAVYFHHMNPPPWWHPTRRGNPLRLTLNWLLWLHALVLAKLGDLLPVFHQPREVAQAGWRFREIMPDPLFLPGGDSGGLERRPAPHSACFIGRISPNKGIMDLLQLWRAVTDSLPDATLVIAGKSYHPRFEERIDRTISMLGLGGNVQRREFVSPKEKREVLARSQLFVFPSYEEGWSLSVMEAAQHGVVPVVYDLPAYDYLDCQDVKVPVGRVGAMADRVVQLLQDPQRIALLVDRLRVMVMTYTRENIATLQINRLERYATTGAMSWDPGVRRASAPGGGAEGPPCGSVQPSEGAQGLAHGDRGRKI